MTVSGVAGKWTSYFAVYKIKEKYLLAFCLLHADMQDCKAMHVFDNLTCRNNFLTPQVLHKMFCIRAFHPPLKDGDTPQLAGATRPRRRRRRGG